MGVSYQQHCSTCICTKLRSPDLERLRVNFYWSWCLMSLEKVFSHALTSSITILMFVLGSKIVLGQTNKSFAGVTVVPATVKL
ncbi:hypothetical protein BDD14_6450 [Edaphobacter modestus]|uniref:Uncharacterized protein n=1 Tax=Edaphobacter modestus TaxID=388466 RepID=A0A4V2G1M4_9BACT|nr:hypothetical protein BDD14_6450 [Edaphobacter modestus]